MDEGQRVGKGVRVRDGSRVEGSGDREKGGWRGQLSSLLGTEGREGSSGRLSLLF